MNKDTFLNFIGNLGSLATQGKWRFLYDKDADSLYWSKEEIPSDSKLKKLSKEISFYINTNGAVDGLIIQYFRNNFLVHNENFAKTSIMKSINKAGENTFSLGTKTQDADAVFGFSESIKSDILRDALEANYTFEDLEKVFAGIND